VFIFTVEVQLTHRIRTAYIGIKYILIYIQFRGCEWASARRDTCHGHYENGPTFENHEFSTNKILHGDRTL